MVKPKTPETPQPDSHEQSGSTGRRAADDKQPKGADTGQNRYGQSGLAGSESRETEGQEKYRESAHEGDPESKGSSNPGSGRHEADETKRRQKKDGDAKDIPKTG